MSPSIVTARLRAAPPLWILAAALVLGELLLSLAGVRSPILSAIALVAPGWAFASLLPARMRDHPLSATVIAPGLGIALTSIVLITLARVGIRLTATSIRVSLLVLVAVALPTWPQRRKDDPARGTPAGAGLTRAGMLEAAGLLGALVLATVLGLRVVGSTPPPGNDWAKYLLYAEQVSHHGALLIRNPFWMLGQPFRDDPGVPALYGAILIMSHAAAGVLVHGILVFDLLEVAAVYALARMLAGPAAGVLAAFLLTASPASQDILGWYGLANLAALVLLALLLAYLATLAGGPPGEGLGGRAIVGIAVTLIGLLAAHRLSGIIALALTAVILLACVAQRARRSRAGRDAILIAATALVAGAGVLADLYARERTFGGTLPYTDYLSTKVDLILAGRDISLLLVAATVLSLIAVAFGHRREGDLWPPIALIGIVVALAFSWLVHLPNYYTRMVYYLPLAAAPLVAVVAVRESAAGRIVRVGSRRVRASSIVAAVAVIGIPLTVVSAYNEDAAVHSYYTFANAGSLRGLDALSAVLAPDEVVVTDRCWSFLATWLLHTRTLAALEPQDIEPAAELPFAREAAQIVAGSARGRRLARALGVRYLILDPLCPGPDGGTLPAPKQGRLVYASTNLAIVRLPGAG